MENTVLKLTGIQKSFGRNCVLRDVSMTLHKGEVLGLIGENGAGKSTLIKILTGVYTKNSGTIEIDGKEVSIEKVEDARALGISVIFQELSLAQDLNIANNIFLNREITSTSGNNLMGVLSDRQMETEADRILLHTLGVSMDVKTPVYKLKQSQKQTVEIARALSQNAKIIIMDEPTTSLEQEEREKLFRTIRALKASGTSIIFVSHALDDVLQICDTIMVLRDGKVALNSPAAEQSIEKIIYAMIGKNLENQYVKAHAVQETVVLESRGLSDDKHYFDISFQLHKGEVLGISGLDGCGKSEVIRTIFGIIRPKQGFLMKNGEPLVIKNPRDAMHKGFAFLSADRKTEGVLHGQTIKWNSTIAGIKKILTPFVNKRLESEHTQKYVDKLNIKIDTLEQEINELSGGNQQKVLLGRWLYADPDIIIMEEPTRGIDVNSKAELYQYIKEFVETGKSVIVVSSEILELLGICNRILVMRKGRVAADLDGDEATQEVVLQHSVSSEK